MVKLIEISKVELPTLILLSYKGDEELLNEFHIDKMTLIEAVASTWHMIEGADEILELSFFKVENNRTPIGYLITSGTFIYSFAIAIQYRTKEILTQWWNAIKNLLGETFTCGLISNNTRAIKYMQDRGMKITWQNPEKKELNEILLTY